MKRIAVNTIQSNYDVVVAASLSELRSYHKIGSGVVIVEKSLQLTGQLESLGLPVKVVEGGESLKSLSEIERLYSIFLELELDKSSVVIAIGGGALTDAAAFAASTFHRGMPCITVPTTLLAQVDASIGGKNGVNFGGVKNIIGTITQPKLVLCDLDFFNTLPRNELSNGVAEIIKAGVIADPALFELLKISANEIFSLNRSVLEDVIARAVQVKADIVSRDEKESHERMKLNLGHTIGHALETSCSLSHGQAVACGMVLEARLAVMLGLCKEEVVIQIKELSQLYELPVEVTFNVEDVCTRMLQDKKRRSDQLQFALPHKIGQVEIIAVKVNEVKQYLSDLCLSK